MPRQGSRGPAVALKPPRLKSESEVSEGRLPDCVLLILWTRPKIRIVAKPITSQVIIKQSYPVKSTFCPTKVLHTISLKNTNTQIIKQCFFESCLYPIKTPQILTSPTVFECLSGSSCALVKRETADLILLQTTWVKGQTASSHRPSPPFLWIGSHSIIQLCFYKV